MKTSARTLCLDLAALLDPTGTAPDRATDAPERDWLGLYRVAAGQLVAPTLYATLAGHDRLSLIPPEIRDALAALHALNDARNRRLRTVLHETVQILNRVDIEPILLKGAVALLPDRYPHAFARMLGDLDLGVAQGEGEAERAADALRAAGYYPAHDGDPAHDGAPCDYHLTPLFHPSGAGYVEIHHRLLCARVPPAALSLPMLLAVARPLDWDGARVHIPTIEHRLLHNALHCQIQNQALIFARVSLRQLFEFARLRALPEAADLDWPAILRRLDAAGVRAGDAVRAHLLLAQWLFDQPLPADVRPTRAARRAQRRFRFRLDHPRLGKAREWLIQFPGRLRNLPKRLATPAWYPAKYRSLRQRWRPGVSAPEDFEV